MDNKSLQNIQATEKAAISKKLIKNYLFFLREFISFRGLQFHSQVKVADQFQIENTTSKSELNGGPKG